MFLGSDYVFCPLGMGDAVQVARPKWKMLAPRISKSHGLVLLLGTEPLLTHYWMPYVTHSDMVLLALGYEYDRWVWEVQLGGFFDM